MLIAYDFGKWAQSYGDLNARRRSGDDSVWSRLHNNNCDLMVMAGGGGGVTIQICQLVYSGKWSTPFLFDMTICETGG